MRIVKDDAGRGAGTINVAQGPFFSKGSGQTSVNDIMEKVGIAKSNFYYYFTSKEDLLDALVDIHIGYHLEKWQEVITNTQMDALAKLNHLFNLSSNIKKEHKKLNMALLRAAYNDENIMIRHFLNRKTIDLAGRELGKIVEQGVQEGVFATPYPQDAIRAVMRVCENALLDVKEYIIDIDKHPENIDKLMGYYQMLQHFTERLLGARAGSIIFVERSVLAEMVLKA